jgi:hypothetical protein
MANFELISKINTYNSDNILQNKCQYKDFYLSTGAPRVLSKIFILEDPFLYEFCH